MTFTSVKSVSAASSSKTTTSTKTTTKNTTKKTKLKKKVTKKTVTTQKKTNVSSKTKVNTAAKRVVEKTTVVTTIQTTKANKLQTVKTTVKTTVQTTTTTYPTASTSTTASSSSSSVTGPQSLKGTMSDDVIEAYYQLKFLYEINASKMKSKYGSGVTGVFSVKDHCLMQKDKDQGVLLHEMGHFLAFANVNTATYVFADETSEWKSIFASEKSAYSGTNKSYYTGSKSEYFAQSVREYFLNNSTLKNKRPKTYAYVQKQLKNINQENIDWLKNMYGDYWGTKF
jgi:hypothetical protein